MYEVAYQPEADEDLEKLDKSTRPEMLGGNYRGVYKLRIGNWRVIYGINHIQKMITVYTIGHRSEIYKT